VFRDIEDVDSISASSLSSGRSCGIRSKQHSESAAQERQMVSPQLSPEQIAHISSLVAGYITEQQEKALPFGVPLSPKQRASMDGFLLPQVLDTTRLLVLGELRIENPPFYPLLRQMGFTNLPNFTTMAAVTFCDVVVSHQPFTNGLLFHELVHAEQYRQLGITRFAELYVRGFLSGGGYDGIPLEINAYELGGSFEKNPRTRFSVADEVGELIRNERL
jgi:hypothetical protein